MPLPSNNPRDIEKFVEGQTGLFISLSTFTRSQLTAAVAARHPFRLALVSDGTSNRYLAISNGSAFYYPDGTAV